MATADHIEGKHDRQADLTCVECLSALLERARLQAVSPEHRKPDDRERVVVYYGSERLGTVENGGDGQWYAKPGGQFLESRAFPTASAAIAFLSEDRPCVLDTSSAALAAEGDE